MRDRKKSGKPRPQLEDNQSESVIGAGLGSSSTEKRRSTITFFITVGTFILGAAAAGFGVWMHFDAKKERLAIDVSDLSPVRGVVVTAPAFTSQIILESTWHCLVSNRGKEKAAIIGYSVSVPGTRYGYSTTFGDFQNLSGGKLEVPIQLDGGETKRFLFRVPLPVDTVVSRIIRREMKIDSVYDYFDVITLAAEHGYDLAGNRMEYSEFEDGGYSLSYADERPIIEQSPWIEVGFRTVRGNVFTDRDRFGNREEDYGAEFLELRDKADREVKAIIVMPRPGPAPAPSADSAFD